MDKKTFICARRILGKTQKQLAEILGTSLKAISSYEQGWRQVPAHVERQIYFLLSRKAGVSDAMRSCWDVKKCDESIRKKCPAWEFEAGKLCWFISGTFCEACSGNSWEEKIEMCRTCKVFEPIQRLLESCNETD